MINEENDSAHSAESDREISRAGDHVVVENGPDQGNQGNGMAAEGT